MFPNGRYDDQVDSTSQALACACTPTSADNFIEYMRLEILEQKHEEMLRYTGGIEPTIRFNHPEQNLNFILSNGRTPEREPDGSFLVTEGEVCSVIGYSGVYRVDE